MAEDPQETYSFVSRAYGVIKLIALASATIVGFIISIVALDINKGHWWVDIKFPLYGIVLTAIPLLVLFAFVVVAAMILIRDSMRTLSYYKSKARNLEATVSALKDLAYHDPITGSPNSNALKLEIEKKDHAVRCLIMLDLQNFGHINKKYNHWIGDEYLRNFSKMVTISGRRNEFLFKRRPLTDPTAKGDGALRPQDEVKAFRKNSGGDEFYILLEGTIIDGLGYLNRLQKQANNFEQMSRDLMSVTHPFRFTAGLVAVPPEVAFALVSQSVSRCLGKAMEKTTPCRVYWDDTALPADLSDSQNKIIEEAKQLFAKKKA